MREEDLGSRKIVPLVLSMSLPVVLSMAMQAIYNVADSLFISHYSEIAFGGVSIIQPLLLFATAIANGIASGTGSVLSQSLGSGDRDKARKAVASGWLLSLIFGLLSSLVLFCFASRFVSLFSDDAVASTSAIGYLRILSPSLILVFVSSLICFFLQAHGMPRKAMVVQVAGAVANIVLDPIFIFTLDMGAEGAAVASFIGYFLSFAIALIYYLKTNCIHAFASFDKESIKRISSVALPSTLAQGAGPIVGVVLNGLVVSYGIEVMAVYGMYLKAESFMFLSAQGISSALIVIAGYNYGRGDYERVRKSFSISLIMAWSMMLVAFVLFQIFAPWIVSLFTSDPYLIEIGVPAFRSLCFCFLLTSPNIITTGLLQGLSRGGLSMLITYTRFFIFLIPLAFILNWIWGLSGLWFAYFAADVPTLVLLIFIHRYVRKNILCNKMQHIVA